jgi:drug/metabolite transporter (DMT)-like permease
MFFLALHIAGNAAFLLLVRVGRGRRFDYPIVGLTNYATAAALAAAALVWLAPPAPDARAALFGAANGAQYQVTYGRMFALYGLVGVAVTTSLLRLAVVVPLLASITLWGEWPTAPQAAGLLLAIGALPLLSTPARSQPSPRTTASAAGAAGDAPAPPAAPRARVFVLATATVLISGVGLLAAKAFAELDQPDQRPVYVLMVYAVATVLAAGAWPWRAHFQSAAPPDLGAAGTPSPQSDRRGRLARSLALGALVGAVNIGQIWVLLPALAQVPGALAFPLAAAGGLALATLGAHVLWHERVGRRAGIGIALAMLAAALANVR